MRCELSTKLAFAVCIHCVAECADSLPKSNLRDQRIVVLILQKARRYRDLLILCSIHATITVYGFVYHNVKEYIKQRVGCDIQNSKITNVGAVENLCRVTRMLRG